MTTPTFDLQRSLAAMADYPALMRKLGVIRTLTIKLTGSGLPINPAGGPVTITARPTWTPRPGPAGSPPPAVVAVRAPAHLSTTRFALQANGRIDLPASGVSVVDIDTDSAAIRLVDFARQVAGAEADNAAAPDGALPPVDVPDQLALPSLRNAGISLNEGDRAVGLRAKLEQGKGFLSAAADLTIEDPTQAIKGVVLDVWDDLTRRWHSTCRRRGTYTLPGGRVETAEDEGTVSLAVTSSPSGDAGAPMYLHQSLLRWTGWSLVAPRPGEPVSTEDAGHAPGAPAPDEKPPFDVRFAPVPGTLPLLRYGRGYRFGLRAVNVAGGVDPLDPASTDFSRAVPPASEPPARYLRFEPVIPPVLVPNAPMTEGESVDTLVIRPEPHLLDVVSDLLTPILGRSPSRHVAPPKVGQLLCEEHGVFDRRDGTPDPRRYAEIARMDKADLSTVGEADPNRPGQRYLDRGHLPVTWLSDPIARGAAVAGLPTGLVKVDFDPGLLGDLLSPPGPDSFRIQIDDGDRPPIWNGLTRLLTIYIPRGESRTVRLSSFVDEGDLGVLGHLGWLAETGAPEATMAAVRNDLLAGQAWQVTPYRTLNLVNAVRVPLQAPVLAIGPTPAVSQPTPRPAGDRGPGGTRIELAATATVHRPSTGKVTLRATWTDPVDDPADPTGPHDVTLTSSPGEAAVDYDPDPVTGAAVPFTATHVLGDTRRRLVDYSLVGTTRYMEFFTQRGDVALRDETPVALSEVGIVPGTDVVRSVDGTASYRRDTDYVIDEDAGTIARTAGSAIPSGSAVNVAIVAPPVSRPGAAPVRIDVLSTARPLPPAVAWIVPTFGWTNSVADKGRQQTRNRAGGGLRIFLERGWWSSGVGEQLAVVLADPGVAPPAHGTPAEDLVTQLGDDPVVVSPAPVAGQFPKPEDFPLATVRRGGLVPVERGIATVAVAAHDVVWDAERQRWAVDVVLPPGRSYSPFVRLVLARYQHGSLPEGNVELSPVAAVEWAQLTPDRSATVTLDRSDLSKVTVTVAGVAPVRTAAADGPNRVSVLVQTTDEREPGDLDWKPAGSGPDVVLASTTAAGSTLWTGTLRLPTARTQRRYRLVITEHEQHTGGGRLVYSDVVPIA